MARPLPPPLSTEQLQATWTELNARYFRDALPPITIVWSRRLTASAGMFTSLVGPRTPSPDRPEEAFRRRVIRLSLPLLKDQPEGEMLATLAHEMIHQWQFDVLKRRPNHGSDFRRKMAEMNRDGWDITISHSLDDAVRALAKYTWRCRKCGLLYARQRRTIRPRRHRCGTCLGSLFEVQSCRDETPSQHGSRSAPRSCRKESNAAGFVQLRLHFA